MNPPPELLNIAFVASPADDARARNATTTEGKDASPILTVGMYPRTRRGRVAEAIAKFGNRSRRISRSRPMAYTARMCRPSRV